MGLSGWSEFVSINFSFRIIFILVVSKKQNGTALFGKSEETKLNWNNCPLLLETFLLNWRSAYTVGPEQQ